MIDISDSVNQEYFLKKTNEIDMLKDTSDEKHSVNFYIKGDSMSREDQMILEQALDLTQITDKNDYKSITKRKYLVSMIISYQIHS